jgi:hypothetical protein
VRSVLISERPNILGNEHHRLLHLVASELNTCKQCIAYSGKHNWTTICLGSNTNLYNRAQAKPWSSNVALPPILRTRAATMHFASINRSHREISNPFPASTVPIYTAAMPRYFFHTSTLRQSHRYTAKPYDSTTPQAHSANRPITARASQRWNNTANIRLETITRRW